MFKNAGQKLKGIARSMFTLTVLSGVILALILFNATDSPFFFLIIPVFIIIGWSNTILLYSYGELCENVHQINATLQANQNTRQTPYNAPNYNAYNR